jgi:hypothetical protein
MHAVNKTKSLALHRTPLVCSVATALVLTASSVMAADTIASGPALTAGSRPLYASATGPYPFAQRASLSKQHPARLPSPSRAPGQHATLEVTDCNDATLGSDSGDLRDTISSATSGDTIDLSNLQCSTITLTKGAVFIDVNDLSIIGPGASALTIDGNYGQGVFQHLGSGTLSISDLTMANSKYSSVDFPHGGCIYSQGSVNLVLSTVSNCILESTSKTARATGGGIYARSSLALTESTVENSTIFSTGNFALGGGVYAKGTTTLKYSTIRHNTADTSAVGYRSFGGGIYARGYGDVDIKGSTISGNTATLEGGVEVGLGKNPNTTLFKVAITNSTIAENSATYIGGLYVPLPLTLSNSTIAFNTASGLGLAAGLSLGDKTYYAADLESSIIALNTQGYDFNSQGITISGSNNLITTANVSVPLGTLNTCPKLAPLADNGGLVFSVALLAGSPAINTGNNKLTLSDDTRGGGFPRTSGGATDIGSYERQPGVVDDVIFISQFESRCR